MPYKASKSTHRAQQIEQIENALVSERVWYERGEVTAKQRPKNSVAGGIAAATDSDIVGDDESVSEAQLEFIRSKSALQITDKVSSLIERVVRDKIKQKQYSNPRRNTGKALNTADTAETLKETESPSTTTRPALHELYAERRTQNDSFMERPQMTALFNEINKDLASIADQTFI